MNLDVRIVIFRERDGEGAKGDLTLKHATENDEKQGSNNTALPFQLL